VFADGDGLYENNGGQDFFLPVQFGMKPEAWAELQIKLEKERLEKQRVGELVRWVL
jgi:hypothetical protein